MPVKAYCAHVGHTGSMDPIKSQYRDMDDCCRREDRENGILALRVLFCSPEEGRKGRKGFEIIFSMISRLLYVVV